MKSFWASHLMDSYNYELNSIERELEKMQSNPSDDFKCLALTGNPYDWQFAIRGPNGTEFQGGIYHGRIQFPGEFPYKRPRFSLLTENGRFKTQTEIKLPDLFSGRQFSVRGALLKLIELLPTYPDGALGSVGYNKKKRRALAIKSREAAPKYGTAERQKLIDEIHEYMLRKVPPPPVPSNGGVDIRVSSQNDGDSRKRDFNLFIANTINADNCERVDGGGDIRVSSQNDRDKRDLAKRIHILVGNTIQANNSKRVGIFDFDNKKG